MISARDTTRETSETARDLREHGVIRDTASAIDETTNAVRETAETIMGATQQVKDAAPEAIETIRKACSSRKKLMSK